MKLIAIILLSLTLASDAATRLVLGGDSTMSGYDQWATFLEPGGPSGNTNWDAAARIIYNTQGSLWATNFARQGWEWELVA